MSQKNPWKNHDKNPFTKKLPRNRICIVSCLQQNLHRTVLGGRPDRKEMYLSSLQKWTSQIPSDVDIHLFTDIEGYKSLKMGPNIEIHQQDLFQNPQFHIVSEKKKTTHSFSDRCQDLTQMKFHWCLDFCKMQDHVQWIDAGIDQYQIDSLQAFVQKTRHLQEIHFFGLDNRQRDWSTLPCKYFRKMQVPDQNIIGTIFGGASSAFEDFLLYCIHFTEAILKKEPKLYLEEPIMTMACTWKTVNRIDFEQQSRGKSLSLSIAQYCK